MELLPNDTPAVASETALERATTTQAQQPPISVEDRLQARFAANMQPAATFTEDNLPEAIKELRANDPARRMFPADSIYSGIGIEDAFAGQPDAAKQAASFKEIAADMGLSRGDVGTLAGLFHDVRRTPPTDAAVADWERQTTEYLRLTYGDRAPDAVKDARRLVGRDPRVADQLLRSGLGSHPSVVKMMIERARSLMAVGKLK